VLSRQLQAKTFVQREASSPAVSRGMVTSIARHFELVHPRDLNPEPTDRGSRKNVSGISVEYGS
jgi:hypothetical protein